MEFVLYIIIFYGGLWALGAVFEGIGKWSRERKENIKNKVISEATINRDLENEMSSFNKILKRIGFKEKAVKQELHPTLWDRNRPEMWLGNCPKCNNYLRLVRGRYGLFYSCKGYPSCDFTINYTKAKNKAKQNYMKRKEKQKEEKKEEFWKDFKRAYL